MGLGGGGGVIVPPFQEIFLSIPPFLNITTYRHILLHPRQMPIPTLVFATLTVLWSQKFAFSLSKIYTILRPCGRGGPAVDLVAGRLITGFLV